MIEEMDTLNSVRGITYLSPEALERLSLPTGTRHETKVGGQGPRPRPGRRRWRSLWTPEKSRNQGWIVLFLVISMFCANAEALRGRKALGKFVRSEEILFDRSSPPQFDIIRRDGGGDLFQSSQSAAQASTTALGSMSTAPHRPKFSSPATAVASTATGLSSIIGPKGGAATTSASSAATSIISAPAASSSLPKAFDGGLGNNFTAPSCPHFLNSFLNNETFTDCMPFSLFLQVSILSTLSPPSKSANS
jgi:hypothetical protein